MKKAIRCIAFVVILSLVILRTYDILKWKDTAGDYLSTTQQLYATEENLIDVVFLGSSHSYCSTSADVMWGEYGYAAFGMNTSGQDKGSTYHMLKEVLKTQSPKVVCVEMWGLTFDEHAVLGNVYRNMLSLKLSRNSIELVQAYIEDEEEQKDYILRWPIIHTRYKELDKYDFVPYEVSVYGRSVPGMYTTGWSTYPAEAMECEEIDELTDANREWLESLYQLSVDEGFELVFFLAPYTISVEEQKQVNAAEAFAKERDITFFDFNRLAPEIGINYSTDFFDSTHLNMRGAEKLTSYLGTYFDENFELSDYRGDERYIQWEKSYEHYEQIKASNDLVSTTSFETYADELCGMKNITTILSLDGNYKESALDIENMVMQLGLTAKEYENGGKYICIDGEWSKVLDNESDDIYIYELNEFDSFKIWNAQKFDTETTNLHNIMLNFEPVGTNYNGINIVVYDNIRKMIIDKRGFF